MSEITLNSKNWLGSEKGKVLKTVTLTQVPGLFVSEDGRNIIKSGTLINDSSVGYGLLVNDVDVTDGPRVGSIMIRGSYDKAKLPFQLSAQEISTLATQGLFEINYEANAVTYTITTNVTNGSISGSQTISQGGIASLILTANQGYDLPERISYTNATVSYDENSGSITIYAPTGNVTITAVCPVAINLQVMAATDSDGAVSGKVASDLQENLSVGSNAITGTLKYISSYSAFTGENAKGNYMLLKATALTGATITAVVEFGPQNQVVYGNNGLIVCRVESTSQRLLVTATVDGRSKTRIFSFEHLEIENPPVGGLTSIAANDVLSGFEFDTSLSINEVKAIIDQIPDATSGEGKTLVNMASSAAGELVVINQDGLYAIQYFDENQFQAIIFASEAVQEYGIETAGWQPSLNNGVLELPNADTVESIDTASANVWNGILVGGVEGTIPSGGLTPFDANDEFTQIQFSDDSSTVASLISGIVTSTDTPIMTVTLSAMGEGEAPILVVYYSGQSQNICLGVSDIPLFTNDHYETTADFSGIGGLFTWDYSTKTLTLNSGTATFVSGDAAFNGTVYGKIS